jgi:hypothetical protein
LAYGCGFGSVHASMYTHIYIIYMTYRRVRVLAGVARGGRDNLHDLDRAGDAVVYIFMYVFVWVGDV